MVLERVVFIFWKKKSFDFPGMIESWDDNAVDFMVQISCLGKFLFLKFGQICSLFQTDFRYGVGTRKQITM